MNAIYDLLETYSAFPYRSSDYVDRMIHTIPDAEVVSRETFIVERCRDKNVVNFGSTSGTLHARIKGVAKSVFGVDKDGDPDLRVDLDDEHYSLAHVPMADVYVVGEVIEHLTSPGAFLRKLRWISRHDCRVIITAPNALSEVVVYHAKNGWENVHNDHVAWYSYHTFKVLVEKCGFTLDEFYWYNGEPIFAEGIIGVLR